MMISIHALLAESDAYIMTTTICTASFLSTLSLRRATKRRKSSNNSSNNFYPRSPCGERLNTADQEARKRLISIHALLAESDAPWLAWLASCSYFYPRSPCGERRVHYDNYNLHCVISIHALLAESDVHYDNYNLHCVISIHALLAESDLMMV